jgi:hypothetical protein
MKAQICNMPWMHDEFLYLKTWDVTRCNDTGAMTRCHRCSTSEYSYIYGKWWLLPDLGSSRDCGSRSVWIWSGIPVAWRCVAVESTSLLRRPSGRHMREREGRGEAHDAERRGELFQGAPSIHVCPTLLQAGSLYSRKGKTFPPIKEPLGPAAREGGSSPRACSPTPKPYPLGRLGPWPMAPHPLI